MADVTVELEGAGDIGSTISSNVVILPLEAAGDVSSTFTYDRVVAIAVEGASEVVAPTLTESIVKSYPTADGWATDRGMFSAITDQVNEGAGEVDSDILMSFVIPGTVEGVGDMHVGILGSYLSTDASIGDGDIYSIAEYGFTVLSVVEGAAEVVSTNLSTYGAVGTVEGNGEVTQSIIAEFTAVVPTEGAGDTGRVVKTWSIVKVATEGVAEIPPGVIEAISGIVLALYGADIKATTFTNYEFDSFIEHNGNTYASGHDGIYLLDGADDNGTTIDPTVTLKLRKLNNNTMKQFRSVFADDDCEMDVTMDGVTEPYIASSRGKFHCKSNHIGKDVTVEFSSFSSLFAAEIFYYNLARRR